MPADRLLLRTSPQLASWWATLEVARFLVAARLRSPYGGPKETFEALEAMLHAAVAPDPPQSAGSDPSSRRGPTDPHKRESTRLLLNLVENIDRQIHNAHAGSLALPPPPRQARIRMHTFFRRGILRHWDL